MHGIPSQKESGNPNSDSVPILKYVGNFPGYSSMHTVNDDGVKAPSNSIGDSDIPSELDTKEESKRSKYSEVFLSLTIEPFLFVYSFCFMMKLSVITNMFMDKACIVHLNYSQQVCQNLSFYEEEKDAVEKMANIYGLYADVIYMSLASLMVVFFGQWSDKYGRKPPLVIAIVGSIIDMIGIIICTYYFNSRLEYLLLTTIPYGLTGGVISVRTIVYSHASDVTTSRMRTLKYMLIEFSFGLGMSLGSLAGGLVYKYASYLTVYEIAAAGHLLTLPWILLVVSETRGLESPVSWREKVCDVFSVKILLVGLRVCMKPRENHGRTLIWLLLGSICALILTSFDSIAYTYVHHMYDWDPTTFSETSTVFNVAGIVVSAVCVPLLVNVLKFEDAKLGILGSASALAKSIGIAFAYTPWLYYLGSGLGLFHTFSFLAVRSTMSKLVTEDELGTVFAFLSACESLVPTLLNIVTTNIFNATLEIFPGSSYLVVASLLLLPLGVFIWIWRMNPKGYDALKNAEYEEIRGAEDSKCDLLS